MDKIIFFLIFAVFPFGQLFKVGIFNLFDALILLLAVITLFQKPKFPSWYKYFIYFIVAGGLSLLLNYQLVDIKSILYLVRLFSYSIVSIFIFNHLKDKKYSQLLGGDEIENKLLAVSLASAIFGWIQYLLWPNLTSLKYLGWDDHLLRMVGTFLDPTFLGLILVLGTIIALKYQKNLSFYFLAISVLFTYSRISYLLLFLITFLNKKYIALVLFILVILFIPKNIGEGTNFARTVSGNNKLINYTETLEIIKKSPVYGVGFNNICSARKIYMNDTMNDTNLESHACSGSDSSILFLLATTGIIGLILFISFVFRLPRYQILASSFFVLLIHSIFSNSLFYPHTMFWLFCLVGLKREVNSQR